MARGGYTPLAVAEQMIWTLHFPDIPWDTCPSVLKVVQFLHKKVPVESMFKEESIYGGREVWKHSDEVCLKFTQMCFNMY